MLDRPVVAFDIETIPDPELGRRLMKLEGDDATVVAEMVRKRREETNGRDDYPQLPWHRIVSVCATTLDPRSGLVLVRSLGEAAFDERSHVEGFFGIVGAGFRGVVPRLVSWNGNGFDLPVLRYRAMKLGVAAPAFHRVADEEGRGFGSRYGDLHVDMMDMLSGYGASSRVGLGTMANMMGLPGKSFLERAIHEHVLAGEMDRIEAYCQLDTVLTMLLFLAWSAHAGHIGREELVRHVEAVRVAIQGLPFPGWREIEPLLAGWPAWER